MNTQLTKYCFSLVFLLVSTTFAEIRVAPIFGSDMVLQRGRPVPVWGTADPNEQIKLEFAGQTHSTSAKADGTWRIELNPLETSSSPAAMVITGTNRIELTNILVGEVWVCSGQSNMDWKLPETANGAEATAAADHPRIRLYFVPRRVRPVGNQLEGSMWRVCTPESARMFSAVAYYFGRDLEKELDVPIGLIHSSWGGTQAEAWTPESYLLESEVLKPIAERSKQWLVDRPRVRAEYEAAVRQWREASAKARSEGTQAPQRPQEPDAIRPQRIVASLWHGMLEPAVGFAIRGAAWYQGESNADRAEQYETLLPTMIKAWRDKWGQGDFPFLIVQLPNYYEAKDEPQDAEWSHLRDAQYKTYKSVPNTGLIATIDIGEARDIHPKNKLDVGKRLARWALADVYGREIVKSGPIYLSSRIEGNKVIVKFESAGDGLAMRDGDKLDEFVIAGEDKVWRWANARIIGRDEVEVWSDQVSEPKAVRYAWNDNPKHPNLTNNTGLPAAPFRTDDWPGPTDGKR